MTFSSVIVNAVFFFFCEKECKKGINISDEIANRSTSSALNDSFENLRLIQADKYEL